MGWDTVDFQPSNWNLDVSPSLLPINSVNSITNIDFWSGYPRTLNAVSAVTVPSTTPYTMVSYLGDGLIYTGYAGPTGVYAWSPLNTQINITPASGLSSGTQWDSTAFGEWGIFSNGVPTQAPHAISATSTQSGGKLAPLPGFNAPDATGTATPIRSCKLIRTHRNILWGANFVENGLSYPNRVRWSTSSITDALPTTWGVQPGNDAGQVDLEFIGGEIVDMASVGDVMFIGGTGGIWAARWIGGNYIYKFSQITSLNGPRGPKCLANLGDVAIVLTLNDLILFDESSQQSILVGRMTELIRQFKNAQLVYISSIRQLYVFYQLQNETGFQHALIWDRDTNTFGQRDFTQSFTSTGGIIIPVLAPTLTWDTDTQTWAQSLQQWDPAQNIFLSYVGGNATGIYGNSNTPQTWTISRTSSPSDDNDTIRVRSIEVDVTGYTPQQVKIRLGSQQSIGEAIRWGPQRSYEVGTYKQLRHDDLISGRYISWEVSGLGSSRINNVRLYFKTKGQKP